MTQDGLYTESAGGVEFLSETLFRTHVPVPAGVTRGQYNVEVYLFRDGDGDQRPVHAAVHRPDRAGAAAVQLRPRPAAVAMAWRRC